jgi:alkylated DNA nucleotide flippase Atl1
VRRLAAEAGNQTVGRCAAETADDGDRYSGAGRFASVRCMGAIMSERLTGDEEYERANELATELLRVVGFVPDGQGSLIGNVSLAVAGGALGIAAGRVMAATSDDNFEHWIRSMRTERSRTRAEHLTEQ